MKYFFHVEDGVCICDPNGEEFADDASAMREAAKVAKGLAGLIKGHAWHVLVKNADGVRIGQVPLAPIAEEADVLSSNTLH
jgi:histidinol phosphatase-like enzyme